MRALLKSMIPFPYWSPFDGPIYTLNLPNQSKCSLQKYLKSYQNSWSVLNLSRPTHLNGTLDVSAKLCLESQTLRFIVPYITFFQNYNLERTQVKCLTEKVNYIHTLKHHHKIKNLLNNWKKDKLLAQHSHPSYFVKLCMQYYFSTSHFTCCTRSKLWCDFSCSSVQCHFLNESHVGLKYFNAEIQIFKKGSCRQKWFFFNSEVQTSFELKVSKEVYLCFGNVLEINFSTVYIYLLSHSMRRV